VRENFISMSLKPVAAAVALLACAATAQATTFPVTLTGTVASFTESHFNFGGNHYDRFILPLSGLNPDSAFTASVGDTISSTVTLDAP